MKIAIEIGNVELREVPHTVTVSDFPPPDFRVRMSKTTVRRWALVTDRPKLLVRLLWALPDPVHVYECARNRVFVESEAEGRRAIQALQRAQVD